MAWRNPHITVSLRQLRSVQARVLTSPMLPALVCALCTLAFAELAEARPGGGHSYSGGRSSGGGYSSGGGGGGDGGNLFGLLFWLVFQHPVIGVPLLIIVVVVFLVGKSNLGQPGWASGGGGRTHYASATANAARVMRPRKPVDTQLQETLPDDPNFSMVLFEDFLYALYNEAYEARGDKQLDRVAHYITPGARRTLDGLGPVEDIYGVIVGALNITSVVALPATGETAVQVRFETNYTEVRGGQPYGQYAVEQWVLVRAKGVQTKPPGDLDVTQCPNCGAAQEKRIGKATNTCAYCDERLDTGAFDWVVRSITVLNRQARGPQLTGHAPEVGTYLPTRISPTLDADLAMLQGRDPQLSLDAVTQRLKLIYVSLNEGWSERKWEKARPFVTDQLFQMQRYWIDEYKRQKLINRMDKAIFRRSELCRVRHDKFYDALTFRVHASAMDYTTREDGTLVAGSNRTMRAYTEYWTIVRRSGVVRAATTTPNCPSCGAGLKVGMAGECGYCGATVTGGDFDWVLTRMEQDESYIG